MHMGPAREGLRRGQRARPLQRKCPTAQPNTTGQPPPHQPPVPRMYRSIGARPARSVRRRNRAPPVLGPAHPPAFSPRRRRSRFRALSSPGPPRRCPRFAPPPLGTWAFGVRDRSRIGSRRLVDHLAHVARPIASARPCVDGRRDGIVSGSRVPGPRVGSRYVSVCACLSLPFA